MATINVALKLTGGFKSRKVAIDGDTVSFGSDGKGKIEVDGEMGDSSRHALVATLSGDIGTKMEIALSCGGIALEGPEAVEVEPETEPWAATKMIIYLEEAA